jgi:hypothetical protein
MKNSFAVIYLVVTIVAVWIANDIAQLPRRLVKISAAWSKLAAPPVVESK